MKSSFFISALHHVFAIRCGYLRVGVLVVACLMLTGCAPDWSPYVSKKVAAWVRPVSCGGEPPRFDAAETYFSVHDLVPVPGEVGVFEVAYNANQGAFTDRMRFAFFQTQDRGSDNRHQMRGGVVRLVLEDS